LYPIVFVEYNICKCLSYPAWSVFKYFFLLTDTQTHRNTDMKASLWCYSSLLWETPVDGSSLQCQRL